jgi:hypothetical protein
MSPQIAGSPTKVATALGLDSTTVSSNDPSLQEKIAALRETLKPTLLVIQLEK